jgi:hypothetical protein
MKVFAAWGWKNKEVAQEEKLKEKNQAKILAVELLNKNGFPFENYCKNDTVLITGDGHTLPNDVRHFESLNIPHDVYCVNRSMLFFERPITHWGAVDSEESVWFSMHLNKKIKPKGHRVIRHGVGRFPVAHDVHWRAINFNEMNPIAKHLWTGNSSLLAILSAIVMDYKRIVLAGIPLDTGPHWYQPKGTQGPNWVGMVYRQWMDLKMERPEAERIRSLSGYSAFIFGKPTKEWLNGNGNC